MFYKVEVSRGANSGGQLQLNMSNFISSDLSRIFIFGKRKRKPEDLLSLFSICMS